jgi:hypothetical protein
LRSHDGPSYADQMFSLVNRYVHAARPAKAQVARASR